MYQVFSLKAGGQRVIPRVGCNAHLSQVINAVTTKGEGRELVSKDLRRDLDAVQSEFGVGYDRGHWQAVWSAN